MSEKHLGIGFIGGGFITRFHIQSLISVRNVDVIGVMSKTKKSAEESAALAKDIEVPYSCQGGVCSSCICKIKEGSAEMKQNSVLTDKEVKEGFVLSCMAVPTSAKLIVDFDDV